MSQHPEPSAQPSPCAAPPAAPARPEPGGTDAVAVAGVAPTSIAADAVGRGTVGAATRSRVAPWLAAAALLVVGLAAFGVVRVAGAVGEPAASGPATAGPATAGPLAPADPPVAAVPFTATPPAQAPVSFDPLVRFARFGRLPDGVVHRTTIVQAGGRGAYTMEAGRPTRSTGAKVVVTFFPQGAAPHEDCSAAAGLAPRHFGASSSAPQVVPAVGGRPAQWADGRLRWEYAPGAWAEIAGEDLTDGGDDAAAELAALAKVAGDLRFGAESLRFPLLVPHPAPDLRLVATTVTERSKVGWSAALAFSAGDYCPDGRGAAGGTLTVAVAAIIPGFGWTGDHANATLDGHSAIRQDLPGGGKALAVYDNPGPYLTLVAADDATRTLLGVPGLDGLYRRAQVLAEPDLHTIAEPVDQSGWTTDPVR
ncbi:hypothetical protein [Catellatospora sp. NPDC049609]|uniref:hypothetical protein n=1 Tax=Catellatospora sp. NPDC049609 TaxID=3155505 RepID=UPI0034228E4E